MDEYRQQQIEALQVAHEYTGKLKNGIRNVVGELEGVKLPDTQEYLKEILKGLNWVIEIVNRTLDVLVEDGAGIDKEAINESIKELGAALQAKQDSQIAAVLKEKILPFVELVEKSTAEY